METRIESPKNERLKELKKLQARKHRERTKLFVAEGEDMLVEAVRCRAYPKTVFYDADEVAAESPPMQELPPAVELVAVRGEALRAAGSLGSGSRLIGVWEQCWAPSPEADVAIYLHEVSDPGNVGAVVRSALALAPVSSVVVLSPGTADPFSPKAVRASMGAIFGQRVARGSFEELRAGAAERSRLIALAPRAGKPLRDLDLRPPIVLCLGSERLGLPESIPAACDAVCHVPLRQDGAESLNVAMTATLCLYELESRFEGQRDPTKYSVEP
jgi:RNA methyltransferase, TrmH family